MRFVRWFGEVGLADLGLVGGKVASLGEMMRELSPLGIRVPDGFAVIAEGYRHFIESAGLSQSDLTQLILGVDRDSALVAPLFNERNAAVLRACARIIDAAHRKGRKVGICGQAPSDFPDFAAFLVEQGIDSISLTPDSLLRTSERVLEAERAPRPQRPSRRAGDAQLPAGNGKPVVAETAEAWSDTEPFIPGHGTD